MNSKILSKNVMGKLFLYLKTFYLAHNITTSLANCLIPHYASTCVIMILRNTQMKRVRYSDKCSFTGYYIFFMVNSCTKIFRSLINFDLKYTLRVIIIRRTIYTSRTLTNSSDF